MLRTMRNDFKKYSWTLWLVIIAFLLGFSFTDIFSGGSVSETVVAKVGKSEIGVESYQKQLFQILDNYKNQMKNNFNKELITQMRIPEQILQNLINAEVIRNEAEKIHLRATEGELKDMIVNFPAFQKDGKFIGISEYKRYLAIFRTNAKDFENDLKKDIVNDKLKKVVTASLVIDNAALKEMYRKENDSAEVDFIKLKMENLPPDYPVPDAEIQEYYDNNKENFKTPETRKAELVALKFDDHREELNISERDIYSYFRENKDEFQIPEKSRIFRLFIGYNEEDRDDILKRAREIREGLNVDNFEPMAREHSTDTKKESGGDWGYTEWRSFTSQEQSIINSLKQGEISDPVDTFSGFSILFAKEKTEGMQEPFETAKPKIQNIMEREALRKIVKTKLDKTYSKVRSAKDLSPLREEKDIKVTETGYLTGGESISDIDPMGYISRKLFTMNEKEINYPVEFMDGIAIVFLKEVKQPEVQPLDTVRDAVRDAVMNEIRIKKTIEDAMPMISALNGFEDNDRISEYLKNRGLELGSTGFKRGGDLPEIGKDEDLDKTIFEGDHGKFLEPVKINGNVVVLRAREVKLSTDADFQREREAFYKNKLREKKDNYFVSYIINKRAGYDIGINQPLYERVKESVIGRFN